MTRLGAVLLAFVASMAIAACGGGDGSAGDGLADTLAYLPASSQAVVVVSTDLDSDQFKELDRIVRSRTDRGIEDWLREQIEAGEEGISYEDDVKPLLGHELVVALTRGTEYAIVFRTADGHKAREVVEQQKTIRERDEINGVTVYEDTEAGEFIAVDGDVLLAANQEAQLRDLLEQPERDDRLTEAAFRSKLADLPKDALVQGYGEAEAAAFATADVGEIFKVPWFAALESLGGSVSFRDRHVIVDLSVNTDPKRLKESDLPFATGREAPQVLDRDDRIVGGNRNQSLTTVFTFRVAEILFADSRFVRDVHALEREFGIDFEDEILRQFDGPSASSVSFDGQDFAARSRVSDPDRLREQIRKVAPRLPRVIQALAPLRSEGQALLFLLAPDALALRDARSVRVIPPPTPDGLYHVVGLTGEGPDELWFGVLGDVFVVASDEQDARKVAREPTKAVEGARGAGVLRVDLGRLEAEIRERAGEDPGPLGELVAWLEASREHVRIQVGVEFK